MPDRHFSLYTYPVSYECTYYRFERDAQGNIIREWREFDYPPAPTRQAASERELPKRRRTARTVHSQRRRKPIITRIR